jgi:hypothetical protein
MKNMCGGTILPKDCNIPALDRLYRSLKKGRSPLGWPHRGNSSESEYLSEQPDLIYKLTLPIRCMPSDGPGALDENIALHILGPLSLTDLTLTRASTTLPHIFYSSRIYCCTHLMPSFISYLLFYVQL